MAIIKQVPTNIITGFLGAGKTTAINKFLAQKPEQETWAILVNEFGQIGIDQSILQSDDEHIQIAELAGGCLCCALGPSLTVTLTRLLRQAKPDRLLIEPTGLGHPAGIIDILQGEQFQDVLDLGAVICMLDPRSLLQPEIKQTPTFVDQLNLADSVLLSKTDLASAEETNAAQQFCQELYPPKTTYIFDRSKALELALLQPIRHQNLIAQFPEAHKDVTPVNINAPKLSLQIQASVGKPLYKSGSQQGNHSCGWVFHADERFDHAQLSQMLKQLPNVLRIKAVINSNQGWQLYNRVADEIEVEPIAYRRESRLELITTEKYDWAKLTEKLLSCRL